MTRMPQWRSVNRSSSAEPTPTPQRPTHPRRASRPTPWAGLDDETVTFTEVQPGVDVELTAMVNGVKEELVLAGPDAATSYEFPLTLEGLSAAIDPESGAVVFTDAKGEARLQMAKGWMYDSSTIHDGVEPAESAGVTYTLGGTPDAPVLRVDLDEEWLADPARVFPVRVDPTTTDYAATDDTYVNSCYTNNYSARPELKVGGSDCQRAAYAKWDVSALSGKTIVDARLQAWNQYSYSCSARNVFVYRVTSGWTGSGISNWPGPSFATPQASSSSFAHGYSGSCPADLASFDVTSLVAGWVNGTYANHGATLRASSGTTSDPYTYKEFFSNNTLGPPHLVVTWTDPNVPFGSFDIGTNGPATAFVKGWAIDPNAMGTSIDVHVYVGSTGTAMTANWSRPDVGAAYPDAGNNHGFEAFVYAAPGSHNVCAYAINVGAGSDNPQLGCKIVNVVSGDPFGNVDTLTGLPDGKIRAQGWTIDPDTGAPIDLHIYTNGSFSTGAAANLNRPDIGVAFPGYGPNHGFGSTFSAAKGLRNVCAYALNTGPGANNTLLGGSCRDVTVPTGQVTGVWQQAAAGPGEVLVSGAAWDPDTAAAVTVNVTVDGVATSAVADRSRDDVTAIPDAYGDNHGFALRIPAALGDRTVCVTAVDASGGQANKGLDRPASTSGPSANCATVSVGDNGLGNRSWYSATGFGISDRTEVSVNNASGNAMVSANDVQIAGRGGFDLAVTRHYNSRTSDAGMFGPGWFASTGADMRIDPLGAHKIVTLGGGSKTVFRSDGAGGWTSPGGVNARLTVNGTGWKLAWYEDGSTMWFNAAGQLTHHTDRDATGTGDVINRMQYIYSSGKLTQIKDTRTRSTTGGWALKFDYTNNVVTEDHRLHRPPVELRLHNGKLTSVTDPEGVTTSYSYNSSHGDLETVTNNTHTTSVTYTSDRATAIKRPNPTSGTDDTTFNFLLPSEECRPAPPALRAQGQGCTTVTDPRGNTTYHRWKPEGSIDATVDPRGVFTKAGWNSNNNVESYTDASGAESKMEYSSNRPDKATNPNGTMTTDWNYKPDTQVGPDQTRNYWNPDWTEDQQKNKTTYAYNTTTGRRTSSTTNTEVTTSEYELDGSVDYMNDARSASSHRRHLPDELHLRQHRSAHQDRPSRHPRR